MLLGLGLIGSVCDLIRGNAATAAFIGAAVLVLWSQAKFARKVRLLGALLLGILLVTLSMSIVYAARDDFLAKTSPSFAGVGNTHAFWSQIYQGFGYTSNPYVPSYTDEVSISLVKSVQAGVTMRQNPMRFQEIMRDAVIKLVRDHPGFVVYQLAAKAKVELFYLLFVGGLVPFFSVGLLGLLLERPRARLLMAFGLMLAFESLFGLLIVPYAFYLLGFSTVAALLGIVAAQIAVGDRFGSPAVDGMGSAALDPGSFKSR